MFDENTIRLLIVIIGAVINMASFIIGRFSAHKAEGEKSGTIASDLSHVKAGNDKIKKELRNLREGLNNLIINK